MAEVSVSIVEKAIRMVQTGRAVGVRVDPVVSEHVAGVTVPVGAPVPELASSPARRSSARRVHIDRDKLRASGLLPAKSDDHQLGQQYRAVKRLLLRNANEPAVAGAITRRLIMVASALPGEGKTFTSINLALSLALEKDHSIYLVDSDAAKPQLSRALDLLEEPGLLDLLTDQSRPVESGLQSLVLPTDVPRLSVLPIGRCAENPAELLSSERMKQVVKCLGSLHSHGIVLFDTSPVLVTIDSRTISSLVGQILLVVKAGATPQQALQDTVTILGATGKVSLILNQAVLTGPMGYYYGYGYGHDEYKAS